MSRRKAPKNWTTTSRKRSISARSAKRRRLDDDDIKDSDTSLTDSSTSFINATQQDSTFNNSSTFAINDPTETNPKKRVVGSANKNRPKKFRNHAYYKDLGRWKPIDDLALIINVQQTNDLKTVHLATKFSCRFTLQEVSQRWSALLYDTAISRVAAMAIRNLHPESIAYVYKRALWSNDEEEVLCKIKSTTNPDLSAFQYELNNHADVFLMTRTPNCLLKYWNTMKTHNLLVDQQLKPLPTPMNPIIDKFQDAENSIYDGDLTEVLDTTIDQEIRMAQRKDLKEIRYLENELSRLQILTNSVTSSIGQGPTLSGEFDNKTLAVLRGRLVRYLMRSKEVTLGRSAKGFTVDIDLSLEGPAVKISRLQGTMRYRTTGEFFLACDGKRPFFVNGKVIMKGQRARLRNNSVIEVANLQFIFTINSELIDLLRQEALKLNLST